MNSHHDFTELLLLLVLDPGVDVLNHVSGLKTELRKGSDGQNSHCILKQLRDGLPRSIPLLRPVTNARKYTRRAHGHNFIEDCVLCGELAS